MADNPYAQFASQAPSGGAENPYAQFSEGSKAEIPPGGERATMADTGQMNKAGRIKERRGEPAADPSVAALSKLAGTAAQVSDMFTGVGKQILGSAVYWGANASVLATTADKKVAATAAQMAKDKFFPPEISAPWGKVAESLGPEAQKAYSDNPVAWVMGKIGEFVDKGTDKAGKVSGLPPEHFATLADQFMGSLGWKAVKPGIKKAFEARVDQIRPLEAMKTEDDFPEGPKPKVKGPVADMEIKPEPAPTVIQVAPNAPKVHLRPKAAEFYKENQTAINTSAAGAAAGAAYLLAPEGKEPDAAALASMGVFMKTHGAEIAPRLAALKDAKGLESWVKGEHGNMDISLSEYDNGTVEVHGLFPKPKVNDPIGWAKAAHKLVAGADALGKDMITLAQPGKSANIPLGRLVKFYESLGFVLEKEQPYSDARYMFRPARASETTKKLAFTGAAAAGGALADQDEPGRGMALGGAIGAIKPKGGMWHPEAVERLASPIFKKLKSTDVFERDLALPDEELVKGNTENTDANLFRQDLAKDRSLLKWTRDRVSSYLNRHAGTEGDPLKGVEIPFGEGMKPWGAVMDDSIGKADRAVILERKPSEGWQEASNGTWRYFPEAEQMKPGEQVHQVGPFFGGAGRGSYEAIKSYLSHVGDYLRQNVDPAKLPQYDLVRAVKETAKNDERVAKEMEKASLASTKDLPVYKDYPGTGMKWVELKLPEKLTEEQARGVKHDPQAIIRGRDDTPEFVAVDAKGKPIRNSYTQEDARGHSPEEAHLAGQLAQEGNQMGTCVGGYCEGVASGESKIYSLRDAKGQSHVTVEVEPPKVDAETFFNNETKGFQAKYPKPRITQEMREELAQAGGREAQRTVMGEQQRRMAVWGEIIRKTPEYKKELAQAPEDILQIKGKQNRAPTADYLPYVQDFVKSGKWGEVGDLEGTGLLEHRKSGGSQYPFESHVSPEQLKLEPGYYTKEEYTKAIRDAEFETQTPRPGEGYPRKERGSADPKTLATIGLGATGAALGAAADPEHPKTGGVLGGILGALAAQVPWARVGKAADVGLGVLSTRVRNISPPVHHRLIEFERNLLKNTHQRIAAVSPFLVELNKVHSVAKGALSRALLTNDPKAVNEALSTIKNPKLSAAWKDVQKTLVEVGIRLADAGRFEAREDYFPRIVKDREGLLNSLGFELKTALEKDLQEQELAAMKSRGTPLTDGEASQIINKHLLAPERAGNEPGFAKSRRVKEVTEKLEPFYHTPTDSLHAYLREATFDLEKAKFFGKDKVDITANGRKYTNTDASIGNVAQKELSSKKISFDQARELEGLLKSRFQGGEKFSSKLLQDARNLANMSLLGNFVSAAAQFGDPIISVFTQGLKPTLKAVAQTLTGKASLKMKDFGLVDHISEEFVTTSKTAKWLQKAFKYGGFAWADAFGKNVTLNAARSRFEKLAASSTGSAKISKLYRESFGTDTPQLITDLKGKKLTPLTEALYFQELSNMQPISKIEMPQAYLDNPNGRIFYMLKSFALKQADVARREGYNEIKKGNVAQGMKNLVNYGIVLGVAGATTQQIQDWMLGKPFDAKWEDIPMNTLKTFGWGQYVLDKARSGHPIEAAANTALPPYKMFEDILRRDPSAVKYLPLVGKILWARSEEGKKALEKQRKAEEGRAITREETPFFGKPTEQQKESVKERRRLQRELRGSSASNGRANLTYSDTPGRGIQNRIQESRALIERALKQQPDDYDMSLSSMLERQKFLRQRKVSM